jgi:hypothetical protein
VEAISFVLQSEYQFGPSVLAAQWIWMLTWSVQSNWVSMKANGECQLHQVHILEVGILQSHFRWTRNVCLIYNILAIVSFPVFRQLVVIILRGILLIIKIGGDNCDWTQGLY